MSKRGTGSQVMKGGGVVILLAAAALGIMAMVPGLLPSFGGPEPDRLSTVIARTIETDGVDAAVAQYRTLRSQGFPGLRESEADTNRLGYVLLGNGHAESAIKIFHLNVETHPDSANVYDSLGEAYLAAGNRQLAIVNYERAVEIDPKMKSAWAALGTLTGRRRPPYAPLVVFHIVNGLVGILSGAVALSLRKGSRWHNLAGRVFVLSMLSMAASAVYIAAVDPRGEVINVLMGLLTCYLVATAWLTARRRRPSTSVADWAGLTAAVGLAAALAYVGVDAANSTSGTRDGVPAGLYFAFSGVAVFAAVQDVLMLRRGGVSGTQRLTRHLWRMSAGLFIAVGSFFLGQPQVFPVAVRNSGLLVVPTLLVLLSLGYWLFRVNGLSLTGGRPGSKWRPQVEAPSK